MGDAPDIDRLLDRIADESRESFARQDMILSFGEYLEELHRHPTRHLRTAVQYMRDMFEHFGTRQVPALGGRTVDRWRVFDQPWDEGQGKVYGQETVQAEIVRLVRTYAEKGRLDKLILLHGPNGSAKTSIFEAVFGGLEAYSRTPEGSLYRFNWLFTEQFDRDQLGFAPPEGAHDIEDRETFAYLPPEEVQTKIICELKDNPLYLLPRRIRVEMVEQALEDAGRSVRIPESIASGELCQTCRTVYESLLNLYQGDWRQVVRHVQVERFFVSKRYRQAAVTIEPQRNVDAQSKPVSANRPKPLPPVLQNVNLHEALGDLVDGNRGMVEYSDFLKRPLEMNKYLLTTSEKGTINLPKVMAYLDVVLAGTVNEKTLNLFKREPHFSSFKGRFALVEVPYILELDKEAEIYEAHMASIAAGKHVTPHTARTAATWAVLTRLKRPRKQHFDDTSLGRLVERLSPLEKARLYAEGEAPDRLGDSERRELAGAIEEIREEYEESEEEFEGMLDAGYEGRRGASPREIMGLLGEAAASPTRPCLSPLAVLEALEELCRDVSVYDFLRLKPQGGYRDPKGFVEDVREACVGWMGEDIQEAAALVREDEYERLFQDYFVHVRAYGTGEKVRNPQTGALEDPDEDLLERVEEAIGIEEDAEEYRHGLIQRFAAHAIDHPDESIDPKLLFKDIFRALRSSFHRRQARKLEQIQENALLVDGPEASSLAPSERERARGMLDRLHDKGYCEQCAKETIAYHLRRTREADDGSGDDG